MGVARITRDKCDIQEDLEKGRTAEEVTFMVQREMANSLINFLKFTGECAQEGSPIPCLDTQMWIEEGETDGPWYGGEGGADELIPGVTSKHRQVLYKFYKKPMAAKLTMLARSALPSNCKVANASAEIQRRLKRMSTAISQEVVEEIIATYMDDLCGMGYGIEWRVRVLRSSILGIRGSCTEKPQGRP